jgi:hypothetical protein
MNRFDELKIEILRYLNNEFRGSEIIVGSAWKNQATLIGIARPQEIVGLNCILKSLNQSSPSHFKNIPAMGYAGYRNLVIASLAMRVLLENSKARVLPS